VALRRIRSRVRTGSRVRTIGSSVVPRVLIQLSFAA
jgi:hypothetical protein